MNFRKQHSIDPVPMQLAPLVDVLFLLVIFFAVTWQAGQQEKLMDVSVPAAEEGKDRKATSVGEIIVNVKNDGAIVVNGQTLNTDELLAKLHNIASVFKDQAVIIRGDVDTPYDKIIKVLDTCQKAGIWNIAFATRDPKDVPAPATK
ncbi:MAG: biopolymer transporter ExbD [Verrucomicrobiaceae bacterium]|nr:biopolymer transporter ExbD [Verrucomicrobiaceae bacterium]